MRHLAYRDVGGSAALIAALHKGVRTHRVDSAATSGSGAGRVGFGDVYGV